GAWFLLGEVLKQQEKDEEAVSCFDRVLGQEKENRRVVFLSWWHKGECLARLGRREEAVRALDEALAIEPRDAVARAAREALTPPSGAASPSGPGGPAPESAEEWHERAWAFLRDSRFEDALAGFDAALAMDPWHSQAWSSKAGCLHKMGRTEEGL